MKLDKYLGTYLTIMILAIAVGATGAGLLSNLTALSTTFSSTGLGVLFSASIVGLIIVTWIFFSIYKMIKK